MHRSLHSFHSVDHAARWKVRGFYMRHQLLDGDFTVIDIRNASVNDLRKIMGKNIRGHANRDTTGSVDQKIWNSGRQNGWLLQGIVEVELKIDCILFNIH